MSCNGNDTTRTTLIVKGVVNELIKDGTIQGGLLDCDGKPLPAQRKVVECGAGSTANDGASGSTPTGTVDSVVDFEIDADKNAVKLVLSSGKVVSKSLCGWRGAQPCEYHATLQIYASLGSAGVCTDSVRRVLYAYHVEDIRDPAADVQMVDCEGRVLGYLYRDKRAANMEECVMEQADGSFKVIGYALTSPVMRVWDKACCQGSDVTPPPPPPPPPPTTNNAVGDNTNVAPIDDERDPDV